MADRGVEKNRQGFAAHNVTAAFPGMEAARRAISALEAAGIESSHISLIGPRAEEAAAETDTRQRDLDMAKDIGKKVMAGAAAGTTVGGTIGFLAGLAAFAVPGVGPVLGAGVWAATAAGGVAGGAVGGVVTGVAGIDVSEAWELTFQDVRKGQVVIGVHADDGDEVERAAQALQAEEPVSMNRFDARGRIQKD